jgi:hypothetical protein
MPRPTARLRLHCQALLLRLALHLLKQHPRVKIEKAKSSLLLLATFPRAIQTACVCFQAVLGTHEHYNFF